MKLYHGSTVGVEKPDLQLCRHATDFGRAFYTTTSFEQARQWAKIKQKRINAGSSIVSIFNFDEKLLDSVDFNVRHFNQADVEWLSFVVNNRRGNKTERYDFVMGPVANDALYATILLYEQGVITAQTAVEQLKTHTLFDQLSFHSKKALDNLMFSTMLTI
jgi:hypothetical protein